MRLVDIITVLSLLGSAIANAVAEPGTREARIELSVREEEQHLNDLFKRKGGGGGGGRGGGGSSSGSSGSRGSSSGGSSSGGRSGSTASRTFGGGKFFGGGSTTPYKAGSRSPKGISPGPLLAVGAAALLIWPAVWLYGAYHYNYQNPYHYYNPREDEEQEYNVICGCDPYNPCGCDENEDDEYLDDLLNDGNFDSLNTSLVTVTEVEGEPTILINGTLSNDTLVTDENAAFGMKSSLESLGWWPVVAVVVGTVFMS